MRRLTWSDKVRIERVVWTLDWLLQDLPGRRRRDIRRDLRANLRAAAGDVGAAAAIRNLGRLRDVAADYLTAEYGEGAVRPTVMRGIGWMVVTEIVLAGIVIVAFVAFLAGLRAAAPVHPGPYTWDGLSVLGISGVVTPYADGGLAVEAVIYPWALAYPLAAFVLGGRLWRYAGAWWRARRRPAAPVDSPS